MVVSEDYNRQVKQSEYKLERVIAELAESHYKIAPLLYRVKYRPTVMIETIGIDPCCRCVYNPEFINSFSIIELKFLVLHEIMHIIMRHAQRFLWLHDCNDTKDLVCVPDVQYRKFMFNVAADAHINDNIMSTTNYPMPSDGITFEELSNRLDESTQFLKSLSTEEIFKLLMTNKNLQNDHQDTKSDDDNSDGVNNKNSINNKSDNMRKDGKSTSDEYQQNESGNDESDDSDCDEKNNGSVKKKVGSKSVDNVGAKGSNERSKGSTFTDYETLSDVIDKVFGDDDNDADGSVEGIVENLNHESENDFDLNKLLEGYSVAWKDILRRFMNTVAGVSARERSWRRPSRKYRDIYPISQGKTRINQKDFIFSIDTSPSMNATKTAKVIGVINDYTKQYNNLKCKYYFFGDTSTPVYTYKSLKEFTKELFNNRKYGTELNAALHLDNNPIPPEKHNVIIITDMCFGDINKELIEKSTNNYMFLNITQASHDLYIRNILNKLYTTPTEQKAHYAELQLI